MNSKTVGSKPTNKFAAGTYTVMGTATYGLAPSESLPGGSSSDRITL